jgi:hypothetical protein
MKTNGGERTEAIIRDLTTSAGEQTADKYLLVFWWNRTKEGQ